MNIELIGKQNMGYMHMYSNIVSCQVVIVSLDYQNGLYELLVLDTHKQQFYIPLLAGDESLWTIVSMVPHEGGLPPLVIVAIQDVEDVTVFEGEARGGSVIVFSGVVVKESSVFVYMSVCWGREEGVSCIHYFHCYPMPLLPSLKVLHTKFTPLSSSSQIYHIAGNFRWCKFSHK